MAATRPHHASPTRPDPTRRSQSLSGRIAQLLLGSDHRPHHTVLHAFNHLLDVGEADLSWVGMFDLAALTALAAALAWLTARAHRTTIMRSPA